MIEDEAWESGLDYLGYKSKPARGLSSYNITGNLYINVYYSDAEKTPYYYGVGYSGKDNKGSLYFYKLDGTYVFARRY